MILNNGIENNMKKKSSESVLQKRVSKEKYDLKSNSKIQKNKKELMDKKVNIFKEENNSSKIVNEKIEQLTQKYLKTELNKNKEKIENENKKNAKTEENLERKNKSVDISIKKVGNRDEKNIKKLKIKALDNDFCDVSKYDKKKIGKNPFAGPSKYSQYYKDRIQKK